MNSSHAILSTLLLVFLALPAASCFGVYIPDPEPPIISVEINGVPVIEAAEEVIDTAASTAATAGIIATGLAANAAIKTIQDTEVAVDIATDIAATGAEEAIDAAETTALVAGAVTLAAVDAAATKVEIVADTTGEVIQEVAVAAGDALEDAAFLAAGAVITAGAVAEAVVEDAQDILDFLGRLVCNNVDIDISTPFLEVQLCDMYCTFCGSPQTAWAYEQGRTDVILFCNNVELMMAFFEASWFTTKLGFKDEMGGAGLCMVAPDFTP